MDRVAVAKAYRALQRIHTVDAEAFSVIDAAKAEMRISASRRGLHIYECEMCGEARVSDVESSFCPTCENELLGYRSPIA